MFFYYVMCLGLENDKDPTHRFSVIVFSAGFFVHFLKNRTLAFGKNCGSDHFLCERLCWSMYT